MKVIIKFDINCQIQYWTDDLTALIELIVLLHDVIYFVDFKVHNLTLKKACMCHNSSSYFLIDRLLKNLQYTKRTDPSRCYGQLCNVMIYGL